jgi:hypothetical protein
MPAAPGIRVARSPVNGYGVVATRPFGAGELITSADGVVCHTTTPAEYPYALYLADGVLYDLVDQTRWINHSCDPNASVRVKLLGVDAAQAAFVAVRDIAPDEEIFFDYALPIDEAVPCACGSSKCRGFIVDADELPRLRQRCGS